MDEWIKEPTYCGKWCVMHESDTSPEGIHDATIRWENKVPEVMIYTNEGPRNWQPLKQVLRKGWNKWSALTKPPANRLALATPLNKL